jgi:hypothetical protein
MHAVEPVLEEPETEILSFNVGEMEAGEEGGMGAVDPVLPGDELADIPGLPVAEMEKPEALTSMRGAPFFTTTAVLPPAPFAGEAETLPFVQPEMRPGREVLAVKLISEEQVKALWGRAEHAKAGIDEQITSPKIGRELLDQLKYFREELLSGRFAAAERHLNEIEYRMAINRRVKEWSGGLGRWLFIYELAWGVVILAALFVSLRTGSFANFTPDLTFLLGSMLWGGLGGVTGAWYALVKHIARQQDFDRQHRMWYITSPLMGIGIGAAVFAILRAGLLSLTGPGQTVASPLMMYIVAWLAGYQQNVFTDIVRRLLQVFKLGGDEERARGGDGAADGEEMGRHGEGESRIAG